MSMDQERIKIGVIVGPTACGKTAASIQAARALDAEIISADSIQVYRGLDIGAAKPSLEERQGIAHHMLDVVEVSDAGFSASAFLHMAAECISDIHARGKFPLVVGGTGLYINALTYPLRFDAAPGDPAVRAALQAAEATSPGITLARLREIDPPTAARLHPNDKLRLIRAMEVYECSGKPLSAFEQDFSNRRGAQAPYDAAIVGLTMDRARLYLRIEQRVDEMLRAGLLEEAKALHDAGYDSALPALQGLGYRQLLRHFAGECSLEQAVEDIKRETRRFAKRQWTWFRRDQRIHWMDVDTFASADDLSQEIVRYMKGNDRP